MILVGGENLIDFVEEPGPDTLPRYVANPGGSPYNVAMALGRQGAPVGYLTPISTDRLGDLLASRLQEDGVELLLPRAQAPSSLAVVSLRDGVPSYGFYREKTAERNVSAQALNDARPDNLTAIHLGSLALSGAEDGPVWEDFFLSCKAAGAFTSLDPNVRAAFIHDRDGYIARIERMAKASDILKLSDEDLEWLYPAMSQEAAFEHLATLSGAALCVLTRGEDGALGKTAQGVVEVPAGQANPFTDTVGAGDTFAGTLIARLNALGQMSAATIADMDGAAVSDLLASAAHAAAINCSRQGCQPPSRAEVGY